MRVAPRLLLCVKALTATEVSDGFFDSVRETMRAGSGFDMMNWLRQSNGSAGVVALCDFIITVTEHREKHVQLDAYKGLIAQLCDDSMTGKKLFKLVVHDVNDDGYDVLSKRFAWLIRSCIDGTLINTACSCYVNPSLIGISDKYTFDPNAYLLFKSCVRIMDLLPCALWDGDALGDSIKQLRGTPSADEFLEGKFYVGRVGRSAARSTGPLDAILSGAAAVEKHFNTTGRQIVVDADGLCSLDDEDYGKQEYVKFPFCDASAYVRLDGESLFFVFCHGEEELEDGRQRGIKWQFRFTGFPTVDTEAESRAFVEALKSAFSTCGLEVDEDDVVLAEWSPMRAKNPARITKDNVDVVVPSLYFAAVANYIAHANGVAVMEQKAIPGAKGVALPPLSLAVRNWLDTGVAPSVFNPSLLHVTMDCMIAQYETQRRSVQSVSDSITDALATSNALSVLLAGIQERINWKTVLFDSQVGAVLSLLLVWV